MIKHENCQSMLSFLSDFVDGELNQDLCLEIESHLSQCPDCSIVIDTLKKTIYLYRKNSIGSDQVPNDVRKRLFRCLNLEEYINK
jgi:anti-sigma factor RsiW